MYLYKLINKFNGKGYIGTSVHPISYRLGRHRYSARRGSKLPIHCAIRKYSFDAFEVQCLGEFETYEELMQAEAKAVIEHGTLVPVGYNAVAGGRQPIGHKRSKETCGRISAAAKGRIPWNFGKKTGSFHEAWNKGKTLHYETWNKGIKLGNSEFDLQLRAKLALGQKNRHKQEKIV